MVIGMTLTLELTKEEEDRVVIAKQQGIDVEGLMKQVLKQISREPNLTSDNSDASRSVVDNGKPLRSLKVESILGKYAYLSSANGTDELLNERARDKQIEESAIYGTQN